METANLPEVRVLEVLATIVGVVVGILVWIAMLEHDADRWTRRGYPEMRFVNRVLSVNMLAIMGVFVLVVVALWAFGLGQ